MLKSKTHSHKFNRIDVKKPTRKVQILSVKLLRIMDDCDTDTSWLGEYSDVRKSDFAIDRAHAEDCASVVPVSEDGLRILKSARAYVAEAQGKLLDADSQEWQDYEDAYYLLDGLTDTPECDCGERGDMERHEYRYFNASFNYVTKDGKLQDGLTAEDARKYVRQDYERMERLHRGDWCFVGVRAEAKIAIPGGSSSTIQNITSGGLWGIESDSDAAYFAEVIADELADLKNQLLALGLSKRAISTAFKTVEEVDK